MKLALFRSDRREDTIAALYGAIVAQARSPTFYKTYQVPDTVEGRLEMVLLHTFLFYRRVRAGSDAVQPLGQDVFDRFCSDMDGNLREMGIGDLAVPRHMRRIGEAFYGRAAAYEAALTAGDKQAAAEALMRNVFSGLERHSEDARRLATYVMTVDAGLTRQQDACLAAGQISFPTPETL